MPSESFRASAALGREAITRVSVAGRGVHGLPFLLRAPEGDLAFYIREAHDSLRRIGDLAPGEARCREREYQQGRAQRHSGSMLRSGNMNGG